MHIASQYGYLDVAKYLVENSTDVNAEDCNGVKFSAK